MDAPPWSVTRARTFQECRRRYYYRYHLAPRARRPNPPAAAQDAGHVKDLVGLEAWAGNVVHQAIETVLNRWRAGRAFSEDEAVAHAAGLLSRQFRDSRAFWSADGEAFPRRPPLLDLHVYGNGDLSRDRASEIKRRVVESVREFMRSELARRIQEAGPSRWLPVDRNASARLEDGLHVLVKPDFAFREGGLLHVIDWKTGRPDPFWEVVQLTCYALYAAEKWSQPLDGIVPQIVYLHPEFRFSRTPHSLESIAEVKRFIRESQDEILSHLSSEGAADEERFSFSEEPRLCRWCPFRGLCDGASREP
jgi:CRISPR/Cas system-associated exonuclease Cas4 (RecB family)